MDMVPNHSSDLHEWFNKSINRVEPYTDYYMWKDANGTDANGKPIPPNNWVRIALSTNTYKYYECFGFTTLITVRKGKRFWRFRLGMERSTPAVLLASIRQGTT